MRKINIIYEFSLSLFPKIVIFKPNNNHVEDNFLKYICVIIFKIENNYLNSILDPIQKLKFKN